MSATSALAEFIAKSRWEDCPAAAVEAARRAILDCLGVMLAGSAALAAAELALADGRALVHAFLLGFEVETSLAEVLNPPHYERGWHATCTLGTLGAAAAAARLLGLDAEQARTALAVAASQASGLKENFGTMTKPFHAGHAARSGILAALLAREGWTASEQAIEGPQGFLRVLGAGK